jgi:CheY-like chemotaxis protein
MSVSILVIDDEPDVAELFRQRFRREAHQGIYVMHFADSGQAALERLSGNIEPALVAVVSDINMRHGRSTIARRDQTALP